MKSPTMTSPSLQGSDGSRGPGFKIPVLYVLQSHLRRGLGRRLMQALGETMVPHGSGEVALWSLASNQSARDFYEAIGGKLVSVLTETDSSGRLALAGGDRRTQSGPRAGHEEHGCV